MRSYVSAATLFRKTPSGKIYISLFGILSFSVIGYLVFILTPYWWFFLYLKGQEDKDEKEKKEGEDEDEDDGEAAGEAEEEFSDDGDYNQVSLKCHTVIYL